jgi:predicted N-formylglutamate amidohydrolase
MLDRTRPAASTAAGAEDPPPFESLSGAPDARIVLLCDHASNRLPAAYRDLGLPASEFHRHIAFDIGAAALTRRLAGALDAPALLTSFSRLLIDPNRGEDDPTLIMRLSDGAVVPGNARVDAAEREERIARYHRPYHRAVDALLDTRLAAGAVPQIVSIHSFTPLWKGRPRPWHAGILWGSDPRFARRLIDSLAADPTLVIGDNEPYSGALRGDTLDRHGIGRGIPHVLIEIRQDLIGDAGGVSEWAARLAPILSGISAEKELQEIRHYGPAPAAEQDKRS